MTEIEGIQKPFAKYLRERGFPFVQARSDKRSTIASSWPDFTILKDGKCCLIETKTKGGRVTKQQFDMHAKLAAAGCPVTVAYSLQECISAVQTWLNASELPREAPASEKGASTDGLYLVQWHGCPVVVNQHGREADFVRLARPDDILTIPRA